MGEWDPHHKIQPIKFKECIEWVPRHQMHPIKFKECFHVHGSSGWRAAMGQHTRSGDQFGALDHDMYCTVGVHVLYLSRDYHIAGVILEVPCGPSVYSRIETRTFQHILHSNYTMLAPYDVPELQKTRKKGVTK